ncbi:transcription initiation factor IIF, beta subunit-domain-containing protein [Suillus ampliporus]|nr:transcription initiation factor IIF, beta subunit-domain-containing protein [Suillus ampliporus]
MLDKGNGRVWLVKIPKHLMVRWAAIDTEDVHFASIRVYKNAIGPSGRSPRIFFLPTFAPDAAFITSGEGIMQVDRYELEMVNEDNVPKDPGPSGSNSASYNPRARTTIPTGRIKHECNLRPLFNESYRQKMRERTRKYNTPRRQILMIEEAGVSRGGINRLSSGVNSGSFANMIKSKPKLAKGTFERMARMPRNQLLDLLFTLFREQPRWSIKPLCERTQQPEAYLKEVLTAIANLNRSGEYNGMWELNDVNADYNTATHHKSPRVIP